MDARRRRSRIHPRPIVIRIRLKSSQVCLSSHRLDLAFGLFALLSPSAQHLLSGLHFSASSVFFGLLSQFLQPLDLYSIPLGPLASGMHLDDASQGFDPGGIAPVRTLKRLSSSCKLSFFLRQGGFVRLHPPLLHILLNPPFLSFSIPPKNFFFRPLGPLENRGHQVKRPAILPVLFRRLRGGDVLEISDLLLETLAYARKLEDFGFEGLLDSAPLGSALSLRLLDDRYLC
jgi:hypothetical protein